MSDLIDRQEAIDAVKGLLLGDDSLVESIGECNAMIEGAGDVLKNLPSAQPHLQPTCNQLATDAISRQAAIDTLAEDMPQPYTPDGSHPADEGIFMAQEIYADCIQTLKELPTVQPEWNNHTVARLLAELFDDTCACNYNGIDEWLPEKCELSDSCPNPGGVACWEQFLKHKAERITDE